MGPCNTSGERALDRRRMATVLWREMHRPERLSGDMMYGKNGSAVT